MSLCMLVRSRACVVSNSFVWMDSIPLCVASTLRLPICMMTDSGLSPASGCGTRCYRTGDSALKPSVFYQAVHSLGQMQLCV